jgi:hypothetical protein
MVGWGPLCQSGKAGAWRRRSYAAGSVTPQCKASFHDLTLPSEPAVIDALVRGTSDVLTLLDDLSSAMLNAVA